MKAKHTPGPWKLEIPPHMNGKRKKTPFEHGREFIIWTTEGHRVGLVDGPSNADMEEKFMANALLIAAAPDLLAALEEAEFALHRAAEQYATDKPTVPRSLMDALRLSGRP